MAIVHKTNTQVLAAPGAIFNAKIETDEIVMDNFGAVHFVIMSGEGATKKIDVEIIATDAEGKNEQVLTEQEITVGGKNTTTIVADADRIAKGGFDRIYLKADNAALAAVNGAIIAIKTNERYSQ